MSNNTSNKDSMADYLNRLDDQYALQALPAILCLVVLMLAGVTGNILVCYVYVAKFKSTTTTSFVSALAFLDLFNCLFNIPFEIADMRYNYTFGNSSLCKIMPLLVTFVSIASGSILVAVAIDRFRKICRPLKRQTTPSMGKVMIVVCCCFAAAVSLPAAFLYGPRAAKASEYVSGSECNVSDQSRQTILPVVYNAIQFIIFFISTVILTGLYALIWRQVSKQQKFRKVIVSNEHPRMKGIQNKGSSSGTEGPNTSSSNTTTTRITMSSDQLNRDIKENETSFGNQQTGVVESDAEFQTSKGTNPNPTVDRVQQATSRTKTGIQKTTLMLFLITLVFVLSFLPYLGLMAANAVNKKLYDDLHGTQVAAYNLFQRSYFVNSASNPVIYSFCSERFRGQLKHIFRK